MKKRFYAIAAVVLSVVSAAIGIFLSRSISDRNASNKVRNKIDKKTIEFHKKQSNAAFKTAKKHIEKAKTIGNRVSESESTSMSNAVDRWNEE